jgi:hypothetical protein
MRVAHTGKPCRCIMSMSNLLCGRSLDTDAMATRERAPVGLDHPTVVPANAQPPEPTVEDEPATEQ